MKKLEIPFMVALTLALPLGCGTEGDDESPAVSTVDNELARLDFEDGNTVRFENVDNGVLISETGLQVNARHLLVREGMSALDAFRALAPGRVVPESLMRAHQRMYSRIPSEAVQVPPSPDGQRNQTAPSAGDTAHDPDLQHTGEFQQSLPFANFKQQMCDFPSGLPNYKHTRIFGHTHTVESVRTAYFAFGSDIGTSTVKACANGICGTTVAVQAGFQTSGFYDAGLACSTKCADFLFGIFGRGCVTLCNQRQVTFQEISSPISSNIRIHDCARFTR